MKSSSLYKITNHYILNAFFVFAFLLSSCKQEIDLYGEYKQAPVVYGLLDAYADTNFIKISRSFYVQGNAYQTAQNPDSCNYPGKLDARLVEYCNGDSVREILLDTITIHDKEPGVFYAPDQKLYYTTERLGLNSASDNYSYRLKVVLPDRTLTTHTRLVGDGRFGLQSLAVNFSQEYFGAIPRKFLFRPAINATFYQMDIDFTFLEQRSPDDDSIPRTMHWRIGVLTDYYLSLHMEQGAYVFPYRPEVFYAHLTEFLGGDTAVAGLKRYIGDYPITVTITAGGEEWRQYVYNNDPSNGIPIGSNEFSLIDGGYGVLSSRMTVRQDVRLAGQTVPELVAKTNWGFKFIGGN